MLLPGAICSSKATCTNSAMSSPLVPGEVRPHYMRRDSAFAMDTLAHGGSGDLNLNLSGDGMSVRGLKRRSHLAIRGLHDKSQLTALAVRRQTESLKRLLDAVVPGADFENAPRLIGARDLAPKFLRKPHHLLDLLNRCHALALPAPQVVLDTAANIDPQRNCHGAIGCNGAPQGLNGHYRSVGRAADVFHEIEGIAAGKAGSADC